MTKKSHDAICVLCFLYFTFSFNDDDVFGDVFKRINPVSYGLYASWNLWPVILWTHMLNFSEAKLAEMCLQNRSKSFIFRC